VTAYVLIGCLTAIASLIVMAGMRFADRSKKPKLLRIGSMTAASGLMLLWIAMWWVLSGDWGIWAMPMFIAALFVPISVLGLGIQLMARACGAPEETHNDRLFEDFLRQNDLP
jgi:hypothetical protein